jgi:hypothetical protein
MKYGEMELSVEEVTPEIAEQWLESNTSNRRLRPSVVDQYARDMQTSAWLRKPVAICFDQDGKLGNGQHTLNAIIASGIPCELLIARHVSRESIAVIDVGIRRTVTDIAHFLGEDMDARAAAVTRVIAFNPGDAEQRSFSEIFEKYQQHSEIIDFATGLCPKRSGVSATILATCARAAANTVDRQQISRFVEVLVDGVTADDSESSAIRLRDFSRVLRNGGGRAGKVELYQKAQTALFHFLRRCPIAKLYATQTEIFPIGDEERTERDRVVKRMSVKIDPGRAAAFREAGA